MTDSIFRNWRYVVALAFVIAAVAFLEPLINLIPAAYGTVDQNSDAEEISVPIASDYSKPLVLPPDIDETAREIPVSISPNLLDDVDESRIKTFDLANVPVRRSNVVRPSLNPNTFRGKLPDHGEFETYTVKSGDSPISIALNYGINAETLLGGNPRLSNEAGLLYVDDVLTILPIDGVLHDVAVGETLESVASLYSVSEDEIVEYAPNNLEFPYRIYPDTQILVPGAVREVFKWDPPQIIVTDGYWAGQAQPIVYGTGTFIWPTAGKRITQVYWYGHPAIDIGLVTGTPIYAGDTGTITYAAWSPYCYGNLIVVNHGNGYESFYAHLSSILVVPGQIVTQGNLIGYSGNTGCSSGPHLHFEIRSSGTRVNPCGWVGC